LNLKITVLGSGTSHGVPLIGCDCAVCRSADPRDRRLRPSILIEIAGAAPGSGAAASSFAQSVRSILVDTSTDLRAQALGHDIRRVDAVLFTHSHADHVMGLDEIRRFNAMQKSAIACYGDARTRADLTRMFAYIFEPPAASGGGIPVLHGSRMILGYRLGTFAYLTDCSAIPESSWPLLAGVRTLVLDALRDRPHPTHFSVAEALEVVARLQPTRTYLTHICHDLPHAATCVRLPAGVELAYDGLVLNV
jgi:phosphoribosyl 1,2-cyclic phosphate phosphodiesterase